jgi:hypothetical protein
MARRILASSLWFVSMWALGSAIGYATGLGGGLLAPLMACVAAGVVAADPLYLFHPRPDREQGKPSVSSHEVAPTPQVR